MFYNIIKQILPFHELFCRKNRLHLKLITLLKPNKFDENDDKS